jgi:hypothetical protein
MVRRPHAHPNDGADCRAHRQNNNVSYTVSHSGADRRAHYYTHRGANSDADYRSDHNAVDFWLLHLQHV